MKTGVIGLGAMGGPMALNLHNAGHLEAVWNRTRRRAEDIHKATGTYIAVDPTDLAHRCELIVTCVSADDDLIEVVGALLAGLAPSKIVIDTSTVGAATACEAAERIRPTGAQFLDTPVTGGVEGAKKGTLTMMAGGDEGALQHILPTLQAIAGRVVHMGPVGAGQSTKAVNQIMCAGIAQGVTEALAFGQSHGLDMDKVIEVVSSGAAGNWFVTHRGPTMVHNKFDVGFKVALHLKDLLICQTMARTKGVELSCVDETISDYEHLIAEGHADEDISALYRLKRRLFEGG